MRKWHLEYSDSLENRINEIARYVAQELDDADGAKRIVGRLRAAFARISETPYRYRLHPAAPVEAAGIRVAVSGSYHVLFRIRENEHTVQIVDVLHGHQDASRFSL